MDQPSLKSLHVDNSLSKVKLSQYSAIQTQALIDSLRPGQAGALKARPNGIILDGHHRLKVLSDRGIDINALPREIIQKEREIEMER